LTWKHIRVRRRPKIPSAPSSATVRADLRSGSTEGWPGEDQSGRIEASRAATRTISAHRTLFVYTPTLLLGRRRAIVKKKESADKPGSVEDNHSSAIRVAAYLQRPTREHVWATRAAPSEDVPPAPLFGLAPGGVCRATECCHRRGALLPHPFTLTAPFAGGLAVCFLLHFPWARAPQALPGALPWEPGLSSTLARSDCLADSARDGGGDRQAKQVICRAAARLRTARCACRR
jgi:hypothetical protein